MLEGTIAHVMESWPLQLMVRRGAETIVVELAEDAVVTRGGETVHPGELVPELAVRIHGQPFDDSSAGMLAMQVEILD